MIVRKYYGCTWWLYVVLMLLLSGCGEANVSNDDDDIDDVDGEQIELEDKDPSESEEREISDVDDTGDDHTLGSDVVPCASDAVRRATTTENFAVYALEGLHLNHTFVLDDLEVSLTYHGSTLEVGGVSFQDFVPRGDWGVLSEMTGTDIAREDVDTLRYVYFASLNVASSDVLEDKDVHKLENFLLQSYFDKKEFHLAWNCQKIFTDNDAQFAFHDFYVKPTSEENEHITTIDLQLVYYQKHTLRQQLFSAL